MLVESVTVLKAMVVVEVVVGGASVVVEVLVVVVGDCVVVDVLLVVVVGALQTIDTFHVSLIVSAAISTLSS
jgi:hypothetical protein